MTLYYTLEKLKQQPFRMTKRIREHGLGTLMSWMAYQAAWRWRERRLGIDTLEHAYGINVWGKDGGQYYDPIDYRCLDGILDYFAPDPQRDVFLDYGSGLGRPVIAAAQRPFQRVIGVENNAQLLELCERHVAAAQRRKRLQCPLEIVPQDAAEYVVPADVNCILIHNFFVEEAFAQKVLGRIRDSLRAAPRPLTLVYVPLLKHQHFLENCDFLKFVEDLPTGYWDHVRILVYRSNIT